MELNKQDEKLLQELLKKYKQGIISGSYPGSNITFTPTGCRDKIISSTGGGAGGGIESIVEGDNITIDDTDPQNPIISATGGGTTLIYEEVTYSEANTLVNNNNLVPGVLYKITEVGNLQDSVFLKAISTTEFEKHGTRAMLCPRQYSIGVDSDSNDWQGVWHSSLSGVLDGLYIYGGKVWKNTTGNIGTAIDEVSLDLTDYVEIERTSFTNNEYTEVLFPCQFDFTNNWFTQQVDQFNNQVGIGSSLIAPGYNPIDVSDWNSTLTDGRPYVGNSNCRYGFFNNGNGTDFISNNKSIKITGCWNQGIITDNSSLKIENLPSTVTEYRENNAFGFAYVINAATTNLLDGVDIFFNCLMESKARVTEIQIYGLGVAGTGTPTVSIGIESIPDLITGITISDLNTIGDNYLGLSTALTGSFNRFFVRADGGDITSGEIFIKVAFTQY